MSEIKITKTDLHKNGYFINHNFVLADDWSISKYSFTEAEQKAFEAEVPTLALKYLEWCQEFKLSSSSLIYKVSGIEQGNRIGCFSGKLLKNKTLFLDRETLVIPLAKLFDN